MLILLNGLIGSGKDTVANYLVERHNFVKVTFGGVLKDVVAAAFGWPRELVEGDTEKSREWRNQVDQWWARRLKMPNLTPRWVLQIWGTNLIRQYFHDDMWIAACERKIKEHIDAGRRVVVSDYRFPQEYTVRNVVCEELVGTIPNFCAIRIERNPPEWTKVVTDHRHVVAKYHPCKVPDMVYNKISTLVPSDVHESEWKVYCCKCDYSIRNERSIQELHQKIDTLLQDQEMIEDEFVDCEVGEDGVLRCC